MLPPALRLTRCLAAGLLFALAAAQPARAQRDDSVDTAFSPSLNSFTQVAAVQSDGKILAGGYFTQANGTARTALARFNANGTLDTAFNPVFSSVSATAETSIQSIAVQGDGKIVAVGEFEFVNGVSHRRLVRLNTDGSVDAGFNADSDFTVYFVKQQVDGKLLIGGTSGYLNNVETSNDLARLNANGTTDTTFKPLITHVDCLALQSDGRILVGDSYTFNGTLYYDLVRLNADGTEDRTFNPTFDGYPYALAVQTDGKILVGGAFYTANGFDHRCLVRLGADGNTDETFNPVVEAQRTDSVVYDFALQPDGKIIAGGLFDQVNGLTRNNLARFFVDGGVDTNFSASTDGIVSALVPQRDNKLLLAGGFAQVDGAAHVRLARLNGSQRPALLANAVPLSSGVYFLRFAQNGNLFGYFTYLADSHYIYHFDLGFEYVIDAADGQGGAYLYDFTSNSFFYTSVNFPFPYLYDFSLNTFLYYYPTPNSTDHYNTNGVRYFYNFATGQIISK